MEKVTLKYLRDNNINEEEARKNDYINMIFCKGASDKHDENDALILDYYYRLRDELKVNYCVTNDAIRIESDSTTFIDIKRPNYIDIKELSKLRGDIIKLAKKKNIKISYVNKTKKRLDDIKEIYEYDYKTMNDNFNDLVGICEYIKYIRKIHMGTRDDNFLRQAQEKAWAIQRLSYRNASLGVVSELHDTLVKLYEKLNADQIDDLHIDTIYL